MNNKSIFIQIITVIIILLPRFSQENVENYKQFEEKFNYFITKKPSRNAWLKSPSPWAPLLKQQFFDVLNEQEKQYSLNAQRFGQCEVVISEELRGFSRLYPNLMALILNADIRENFETVLLPQFSYALQRCHAFARLIPIIERTRRRFGLDETFDVALPRGQIFYRDNPHLFHLFDDDPLTIPEEIPIFQYGLSQIFWLGLCKKFAPSIEDVVWFETKLYTNQLGIEDLLWFETWFEEGSSQRLALEKRRRSFEKSRLTSRQRRLISPMRLKAIKGEALSMPDKLQKFCKYGEIK